MKKYYIRIRNNFYWFVNKIITGYDAILDRENPSGKPFLIDINGLQDKPKNFTKLRINYSYWRDLFWAIGGIIYLVEKILEIL